MRLVQVAGQVNQFHSTIIEPDEKTIAFEELSFCDFQWCQHHAPPNFFYLNRR